MTTTGHFRLQSQDENSGTQPSGLVIELSEHHKHKRDLSLLSISGGLVDSRQGERSERRGNVRWSEANPMFARGTSLEKEVDDRGK